MAVPIATSYSYYYLQKWAIRKEVKAKLLAGLPKDSLIYLQLDKVEAHFLLDWEHDREFAFKGQKYDVVETLDLGDSVAYWCWWDHEETQLTTKLDSLLELANSTNPYQGKNQKRLNQFLQGLYCTDLPCYNFWQPYQPWSAIQQNLLLTCRRLRPLTPPPQFV